jgi:glycosyltransferase involved in cell wall biosynthesis
MLIDGLTILNRLNEFNIKVNGVLHIGAHECEEKHFYNNILNIGDSDIIWVDGNSIKVEEMIKRGIVNIYQSVLDDTEKDIEFNITNNSQASSILCLNHEEGYYNDINIIHRIKCKSETLCNFFKRINKSSINYNFWNLDIQGVELNVLRGSKELLNTCDAIYTEVNSAEVYKGCGLIGDIDKLLSEFGFTRVDTLWTDKNWGDALYVKHKKSRKLVVYINGNIPHKSNYDAIKRMCKSHSIHFEVSNSIDRIRQNDYDILLSMSDYIDYNLIPENIKIIYGPQFFVLPEGSIVGPLESRLVDRCVFNCLSTWIKDLYLEFTPSFIAPIHPLPFSVDTEKFKPLIHDTPKKWDCILYIKRRKQHIIDETINILNSKRLNFVIFTYGSYNESDYINALHDSKFMLTLDAHESQGFALEESMSCNVPLLVIDAQSMYDETNDGITSTYAHRAPKKLLATSVPYWYDDCGIKVKDTSELSDAIDRMLATYKAFTPRRFIEENLSDRVCMQRILDYFKLQ